MRLFDYIFYRSVRYYATRTRDHSPEFSGVFVVTLLQVLFFYAIVLFPLQLGFEWKFLMPNIWQYLPAIVALLLNCYRYYVKKPYVELCNEWVDEPIRHQQNRKLMLVLCFIIVLTILVIEAILFQNGQ